MLQRNNGLDLAGNDAAIVADQPLAATLPAPAHGLRICVVVPARDEAEAYESQYIRSETGLGAAGASAH